MRLKVKQRFTTASLEKETKKILNAQYQVTLNELIYIGLEFISDSRSKTPAQGGFNDRTGNLRASLGFIVMYNGERVYEDFTFGSGDEGKSKGSAYADKLGSEYPNGWALILVAGMEYASYVEGRGFDVLTGATLNAQTKMADVWKRVDQAFENAIS